MDDVQEKIKNGLNKINKGEFGFFIVDEWKLDQTTDMMLKNLLKKFRSGVYVSFDKSLSELNGTRKKLKVRKNLHLCGKHNRKNVGEEETGLNDSTSLVELSVVIQDLLRSGKYDFILLESVSSLLLKNEPAAVAKFLNYLIEHNRIVMLHGAGSSVDSEGTSLLMPKLTNKCAVFEALSNNDGVKSGLVGFGAKEISLEREKEILNKLRNEASVKPEELNFKPEPFSEFNVSLLSLGIFFIFLFLGVSFFYISLPGQVSFSPGARSGSGAFNYLFGIIFLVLALLTILFWVKKKTAQN